MLMPLYNFLSLSVDAVRVVSNNRICKPLWKIIPIAMSYFIRFHFTRRFRLKLSPLLAFETLSCHGVRGSVEMTHRKETQA